MEAKILSHDFNGTEWSEFAAELRDAPEPTLASLEKCYRNNEDNVRRLGAASGGNPAVIDFMATTFGHGAELVRAEIQQRQSDSTATSS